MRISDFLERPGPFGVTVAKPSVPNACAARKRSYFADPQSGEQWGEGDQNSPLLEYARTRYLKVNWLANDTKISQTWREFDWKSLLPCGQVALP
jgi:hypothetical protein